MPMGAAELQGCDDIAVKPIANATGCTFCGLPLKTNFRVMNLPSHLSLSLFPFLNRFGGQRTDEPVLKFPVLIQLESVLWLTASVMLLAGLYKVRERKCGLDLVRLSLIFPTIGKYPTGKQDLHHPLPGALHRGRCGGDRAGNDQPLHRAHFRAGHDRHAPAGGNDT